MKRDRVVRRGIELILLNVTLRAIAPPTPFVPAGNKRRFHPRDVVKLLSPPFLPSFISSPRIQLGIHGIRKNDLRSSRISPPFLLLLSCETCARMHTHVYTNIHGDGGSRSEWVATRNTRIYRRVLHVLQFCTWGELSVARDVFYY